MGEDEIAKGMHTKVMEWSRECDWKLSKKEKEEEATQWKKVQDRKSRAKCYRGWRRSRVSWTQKEGQLHSQCFSSEVYLHVKFKQIKLKVHNFLNINCYIT